MRGAMARSCHDKAKVKRYARFRPVGSLLPTCLLKVYLPTSLEGRRPDERRSSPDTREGPVHAAASTRTLVARAYLALISETSSAMLNESPITRVINQDHDSNRQLMKNYTCTNATLDLYR